MILGDNPAALTAFKKVYETYPDSNKAPDALLRAADLYRDMGQTDEAKSLYQKLVKDFSSHSMADKAKQRLNDLKGS